MRVKISDLVKWFSQFSTIDYTLMTKISKPTMALSGLSTNIVVCENQFYNTGFDQFFKKVENISKTILN